MKRTPLFFKVFSMNSDYFKIFVIIPEERTSARACFNWHVEYEIMLFHVYLPVIFCKLFRWRVAYYSYVFEGLLDLILSLQKVIAKATEVFF